MRFFIRQMPTVDRIGPCTFSVHVNAYPDWIPQPIFEPPFVPLYFEVFVTKQALELDPVTALKETLAASGEVDETHYIKPRINPIK